MYISIIVMHSRCREITLMQNITWIIKNCLYTVLQIYNDFEKAFDRYLPKDLFPNCILMDYTVVSLTGFQIAVQCSVSNFKVRIYRYLKGRGLRVLLRVLLSLLPSLNFVLSVVNISLFIAESNFRSKSR